MSRNLQDSRGDRRDEVTQSAPRAQTFETLHKDSVMALEASVDAPGVMVRLIALNRKGQPSYAYLVEGLTADDIRGLRSASSMSDAAGFLLSRTQSGAVGLSESGIESDLVRYPGEGLETYIRSAAEPRSFEELCRGVNRQVHVLTQLTDAAKDTIQVVMESERGALKSLLASMTNGHSHWEFDLTASTADLGAANSTLFKIMERFRTGGFESTVSMLMGADEIPEVGAEQEEGVDDREFDNFAGSDHSPEPEFEPDADSDANLHYHPGIYNSSDLDPEDLELPHVDYSGAPRPHFRRDIRLPENGRVLEGERDCGAKVECVYTDKQAVITIAPVDLEKGDAACYQVELKSPQAAARIEDIFRRMTSSDDSVAIKALEAIASLGPWTITLQPGEKHRETIQTLQDAVRWDLKQGSWYHFPLEPNMKPEIFFLKGCEYGVQFIKDRPCHEFSRITFMLDERGEGSISLNNVIGGRLTFELPELEDASDDVFGRTQDLKRYLDLFNSSPASLVAELFEDCRKFDSENLPFPYGRKDFDAYEKVGALMGEFLKDFGHKTEDVRMRASSVKYLGDGAFEAYLPGRSFTRFSALIRLDADGVSRVELWRHPRSGLLQSLGRKEHYVFDLDSPERSSLDKNELIKLLKPAGDETEAANDKTLLEKLSALSSSHQGFSGRIRTFLQGIGLWRHRADYF
jgi:hypothetical protein